MGEGKGVVKKIRGGGELLVGYQMEARNEGVFTTPAAHSALEILTSTGRIQDLGLPKSPPASSGVALSSPQERDSLQKPVVRIPPFYIWLPFKKLGCKGGTLALPPFCFYFFPHFLWCPVHSSEQIPTSAAILIRLSPFPAESLRLFTNPLI
jgi:hypothetical protein